MTTLHDFSVTTIDGQTKPLADYKGKVLLVVNVASRCGLTPHYAGLEELYRAYHARGFEVLGFPCNDFGAQEPGTEAEIMTFCTSKYDVTFPMFAKLHVKGAQRAPLYEFLTTEATSPDGPGDITWNFAKFVIGKDGRIVARFSPTTLPGSDEITRAIEKALG